jgi:hypothetical protein
LTCLGLSCKYAAANATKKDIQEILAWLFEAAHLADPPLDLDLNNSPKVSDAEYLLFSL